MNAPIVGASPGLGIAVKICFVPVEDVNISYFPAAQSRGNVELNILAKVLICSRTTSMPLSSEALSSRTICLMFLGPYIRLARARIVDVLPVPGGP